MNYEATIGQISWDGKTYDVDWPYGFDCPGERADHVVFYLDGVEVAEMQTPFCPPSGSEAAVLEMAQQFAEQGGLDND